jgi:hypothetical protein
MSNPFENKESSRVFVPSGDTFIEVTGKIEETSTDGISFRGISLHLGYHPDQLRGYFGQYDIEFDIQQVVFEIFTDRIVFALTKSTVDHVDQKKLNYFLKDFKQEGSITARGTLLSGVDNKSLSIEFLTRVLNLDKGEGDGGIIFCKKLGLMLYFADGHLTDFQSW